MEQALWIRNRVYLDEYLNEMIAYWNYTDDKIMYTVSMRDFFSGWGEARHVTIFKEHLKEPENGDVFEKEPSMEEKRFVLNGIKAYSGIKDSVAFEVFPAKENIVDRINMYHLWVVSRSKIPFNIKIKIPRFVWKWKKAIIDNTSVLYTVRNKYTPNGKIIQVYFIKSTQGKELKWYTKQEFKDIMIGQKRVAIELVSDSQEKLSVLVCAPKSIEKLPFGLR